jgi:DNA-binding Lrp family transcriptional regulator
MSYNRTFHKNALFKMVREKGLILLVDAAELLNVQSSTLRQTSARLEQNGKIKRQKIKVRYKNGNLNDAWLLYLPGTSQNTILDYERDLINRPYSSPLKEHHCYKKNKDVSEVVKSEITQTANNNNVIQMQDYVRINNQELAIKEYKGQRVVTAKEIAQLHHKEQRAVNQQLERNKKYFVEGVDYFILSKEEAKVTGSDFKKYFTSNRQNDIYLYTETGYMLLTKTFMDELSWTVQRELVNTYFKMKELKNDQSLVDVQLVQNVQMIDFMEMMVKEFKNQNERVTNLENKFNNIVNVLAK